MSTEAILTFLTGVPGLESRPLHPGHGRVLMARRCEAITKKGTQCTRTGRYFRGGQAFCITHENWLDD